MKCPCGSKRSFANCCSVYISAKKNAPTAVKLMRSRYTAYALGFFEYIAKTMCGPAALNFDLANANKNAKSIKWQSLKVLNSKQTTKTLAFVEFTAKYQYETQSYIMHELSEFHFIDNCWYYYDGTQKTS